ncbi:MAG: SMP-30/gluconolactonase/LRE family protein [Fimbriiglobus sp.]
MSIPQTTARVLVSPLNEAHRYLPEGPREVVVGGNRSVVWVNIQTGPDAADGTVHVHALDVPIDRYSLPAPGRPGFLLPTDRPNTVLVGLGKELRTLDLLEAGWSGRLAAIPDDNPRTIINDAEVVPGGNAVVFGTKDVRFADPLAVLYLYTPADRRITELAGKQTCSNGKVFARDAGGLVLFDIDTPRKSVVRYRLDLETRSLSDESVALDLTGEPGFPDGMADGGDGTVIVAFYNPTVVPAGRAVRYRLATGEPLEEWRTPGSPRVTCPRLVRTRDGVKLILTTATEGMPADERAACPNAGCIFMADTGFAEAPATELVRL